jgi:asparagine synthase (glutamine-hydrolysing)
VCGIFATLARSPVDERDVVQATSQLEHRGPDGQGIWLSADACVALGHQRLSLVGIANGQQPIASEDGQTRAVVNGEFYNYRRIVDQLEEKGHKFRTQSDSEIAVHLYEEHGLDFVEHLRGEFSLVLWDARQRRLLAVRDRFGVKPLVYSVTDKAIVIASEAKALFAWGVSRAWDHESFFNAASMQYVRPDRTLFRGVRQIPPGCMLIAWDGDRSQGDTVHTNVRRYWQIPRMAETQVPAETRGDGQDSFDSLDSLDSFDSRAQAELIAECRRQVVDATIVRLHGDESACFQLSGGLDSSVVVAIATEVLGRPVDTYTVTFDQAEYDEFSYAGELNDHVGARGHAVRVTPADVLANLPEAVRMSEGLCINGHLSAKHLLHKQIQADGFKVVLTGEGADEAFAGYGHLRVDHWRTGGSNSNLERHLSRLAATNHTSLGMMLPHGELLDLSSVERRLGFIPTWLQAKASFGYRLRPLLRDEFLEDSRGRDPFGEFIEDVLRDENNEPARGRVDLSTLLWSKSALANYILKTLGDGTEMANSVEGRVPFLDHRLWEFVSRVPLGLKIRDSTEKFILREATRDCLPSNTYRREKHPFDVPPVSLVGDPHCWGLVTDMLSSEAFRSQPFFDVLRTQETFDELAKSDDPTRVAWDPIVMTVLSVVALHDG